MPFKPTNNNLVSPNLFTSNWLKAQVVNVFLISSHILFPNRVIFLLSFIFYSCFVISSFVFFSGSFYIWNYFPEICEWTLLAAWSKLLIFTPDNLANINWPTIKYLCYWQCEWHCCDCCFWCYCCLCYWLITIIYANIINICLLSSLSLSLSLSYARPSNVIYVSFSSNHQCHVYSTG